MDETEPTLKAGYMLDRYELLCPLASGGMATVWLARMRGKHGFEKLLAVKTIRAELSDDPHFEEMFLDEARIAAKIQHPNVAQIIDLGEQDEVVYLVMEWVDGEALSKARRYAGKNGARVPLGIALRIIGDAAAGLHAAHELRADDGELLGVVHRDVSPQNILISTGGDVKIIDFGVAKATNRLAPQTRSGIIKGKLQYMAPEQALGRPIDRRVDVWALGVCLYELVADRLPFDGENQLELLQKLSVNDPPPPIEGAVPAVVEAIIARSLARDPEGRYATCAAMRRAIESALSELELPCANEDIAAFVAQHLPDRAAKRHELVSRALRDASSRGHAVLQSDEPVGAFDGTVEVDANAAPPSRLPTRVTLATKRERKLALEPQAEPELHSQPSNATLGSAAVVESRKELLAIIPRSRSGTWVAWILVAGALAGGFYVWQRYRTTSIEPASTFTPSSGSTSASAEPPPLTPASGVASVAASAKSAAGYGPRGGGVGLFPFKMDGGSGFTPIPLASASGAPSSAASTAALASALGSALATPSATPTASPSASTAPSATPSAAPTTPPPVTPDPPTP